MIKCQNFNLILSKKILKAVFKVNLKGNDNFHCKYPRQKDRFCSDKIEKSLVTNKPQWFSNYRAWSNA